MASPSKRADGRPLRSPSRARCRCAPQLSAKQRVASIGLFARGADLARPRQTPHEQLVRAVVEPVQRQRARRQRARVERITDSQGPARRIPQHRLAKRVGDAKRASQLRQRPAQRATRIIGIAEHEPGQPRTPDRSLCQRHVRQHGPGLATARRRDNDPIALDLRRS